MRGKKNTYTNFYLETLIKKHLQKKNCDLFLQDLLVV